MKCAKCGKLLKIHELVVKVQQMVRPESTGVLGAVDLKENLAHLECPTLK